MGLSNLKQVLEQEWKTLRIGAQPLKHAINSCLKIRLSPTSNVSILYPGIIWFWEYHSDSSWDCQAVDGYSYRLYRLHSNLWVLSKTLLWRFQWFPACGSVLCMVHQLGLEYPQPSRVVWTSGTLTIRMLSLCHCLMARSCLPPFWENQICTPGGPVAPKDCSPCPCQRTPSL